MKLIKYLIVCWCLVFPPLSFTSGTNSQSALNAYKNAEEYRKKSDLENAIWHYKLAIQCDRSFAEPYYKLGTLYQQQLEFDLAIDYLSKYVKRRPKYYSGYEQLGLAYWNKKDYKKSLDNFLKVRALTPDIYNANINVGLAYTQLKEYGQAIVALKRAISLDSGKVSAHYLLARSYEGLGMKNDYYRELQKAGELNLDYKDIRERLVLEEKRKEEIRDFWVRSNSYMSQKKYKEAISELNQYLELNGDSFDGYLQIGQAYYFQGDYENAQGACKKALALDPSSELPHQTLAMVYNALDEKVMCHKELSECRRLNPKNKACIDMMKRFDDEFDYHTEFGGKLLNWGQFDQAIKEFRLALMYYPDHRDTRLLLGKALDKSGNVSAAEEEFNLIIKQSPDDDDKEIIYNLAELYASHKQEKKAITLYQDAIKRGPEDVKPRLELALLYEKTDEAKRALQEFKHVLEYEPDNKKALDKIKEYDDLKNGLLNRGMEFYEKKQYEKAITEFKRLGELDEDDYRVWLNLGRCYEQSDKNKEAINAYEKAIQLDGDSYETLYEFGRLMLKSDPEKAVRFLEKACKKDNSHIEAYLLLAQAYKGSGDFSQSVKAMKQVLKLDPDNQIAGEYVADLRAKTIKRITFGALFIVLIVICVTSWNSFFFASAQKELIKSEELLGSGDIKEALSCVVKARKRLKLSIVSKSIRRKKWRTALARSFRYEAETCDQMGQRESLLLKAIDAYSGDYEALLALAEIALTKYNYDDCIKYAKKAVVIKTSDDRGLITLGKGYYFSGKYRGAVENFSKVSQLEEKEIFFHARSLQELGRHDEVINLLDSISSPSERYLEKFLCCKACSLAELENYVDALENFEAAYKINSSNFGALRDIAHCNYMLRRYEEASRLYAMLKSMQPESVEEINLQAAFSSLAAGDTENAKIWLMSCDATGWVTPYLLGKIIAESDAPDVELAVGYFGKCLASFESFPVKPDIYQNLAVLYAGKMDFKNALDCIGHIRRFGNTEDIPEFNLLEAYCLIGREDYLKAISLCIGTLDGKNLDIDKKNEVENMLITAAFFSAKKSIAEGNYLGGGYAIEKVIELSPELPIFKKALAGIYSNLAKLILNGDELKANGKFEREFIEKHGILVDGDKLKMAEQLIHKAELIYPDPDYTFNRAVLCIRLGEFSRAIEVLQNYEGEDRFNYLIALARLQNGEMAESESLLAELIKSENPEIRRKSKVIKAAYFLCPKGEWEEASELLLTDSIGVV